MKKLHLLVFACLSLAWSATAMAQNQHAFLWDNTHGMQDLGTLGGNTSYALGINDAGEVVGYSYLADNVTTHAFTWTAAGGMVDIGASFPGGGSTQGNFINSSGNVAGTGTLSGQFSPSFFTPPNTWQSLPRTTGDFRNFGYGINESNQITGQRYQVETLHGYLWSPLSGTLAYLQSLPNGLYTVGTALNNFGHVTGTATDSQGRYEAALWTTPNQVKLIGRFDHSHYTAGQSINDSDQVAGFNSPELEGFYWTRTTGIVALAKLGVTTSPAFGINAGGMISGYSRNTAGATHAVLWASYTSAPQDLGTLPGGVNSYGRGLNNSGQVVGYADVP